MNWWSVINTPGTELAREAASEGIIPRVLDGADALAPMGAIVLLLLTILGSKKAGRWLYWLIALYVLLKLVLVCI